MTELNVQKLMVINSYVCYFWQDTVHKQVQDGVGVGVVDMVAADGVGCGGVSSEMRNAPMKEFSKYVLNFTDAWGLLFKFTRICQDKCHSFQVEHTTMILIS